MSSRSKVFQSLYKAHRWLGLFLALHLFVLILTGTLLVFHEEWKSLGRTPTSTSLRDPSTRLSLQTLLETAQKADPNGIPLAINFDDHDPDQLTIRMGQEGSKIFRGSTRQYFDRYIGSQSEIVKPTGFWDFVLRLHREFLLGFYGKLYVGLIGIMLGVSLLTGLYIYGPTSLRLAFGFIRRGRSTWTWSDIHKAIGAGSFAWLGLIAITGSLLATSGQLLKLYQYTELNSLRAQYPLALVGPSVSLDEAEKNVLAFKPGSEIAFITFPDTEFSTGQHFIFVVNDKTGWKKYLSELVLVDGSTGAVIGERGLPWYLKAAILSEPLHFGNYGGVLLKIIWTLFGCFGLILSLTGPILWYLKRKKQTARSFDNQQKARKVHPRGPYFIPACLGILTFGSSLLAMSSSFWMDLLSGLLLTIPLIILSKILIRALRASP